MAEITEYTVYNSLHAAAESLTQHEIQTNCRYAVYRSTKDFGNAGLDTAKKVYWEDQPSVKICRQNFSGIPFVVLGQKVYDCQFGKNRKEKRRRMRDEKRNRNEDRTLYTKGKMCLDTKKIDCPAKCVFREICRFPSYRIQNNTLPERRRIAEYLMKQICSGQKVEFERVIVTKIATLKEHTCHQILGEIVPEPIDPRLARKIVELCNSGVNSLNEMRSILKGYVRNICSPLPLPSNRRFYPTNKCISNHMFRAMKKERKEDQQIFEDLAHTHPSVRIKGTETNYIPVQCFDPLCADKSPHMHCPFCVKTESYVDPVILKAHYRVKHVDKGIEFAGLKVLRCCDRCDIVGVIKGEKKFKGAHWHCYKCRNGFNRRDEAIKHYKTHFRNPQTTFQIQIAQDINQPVTQAFETEEAASCIPTDSFSVHASLTEAIPTQTSGMSILPRGLEGMVTMPGVGAVETVGVAETQTIMIIQDDGQGNISTMQELCTTQDSDPDLTVSDNIEDTNEDTVQQLREKIAQLEKEKAEQTAHIALLSKKIEEQAEQIAAYKLREQGLLEQMQQVQQGIAVPQDTMIQDLCNQLETQHKQLIRQQITQLKHSLVQTSVHPKMLVLNASSLGAQLGQTVNLQTFQASGENPSQVSVALDFNSSADENDVNSGQIQTDLSVLNANSSENTKETGEMASVKNENLMKDSEYPEILVHSLHDDLSDGNPIVENDGSICAEPRVKRRKEK